MNIPLNEFEQFINESILEKGYAYFNKGAVLETSLLAPGELEAIVMGTEEYTIHLNIKNNTIVNQTCDCPYSFGPVCKHVAAVIFDLQQEKLGLKAKKQPKPRKKKAKSVAQQVKEILQRLSHEELMTFVEENAKKDKDFRLFFLSNFGHLIEDVGKSFYKKQIHAILRNAARRRGWIDRNAMRAVMKSTMPFVQNANSTLEKKDFEKVFHIACALLEEMTDALQYADDSNGDIGYFIYKAREYFAELGQRSIPNGLKQEIFEYCITAYKQKNFEGWDWHLEMLDFASDLAENEEEADIILSLLDKYDNDFGIETAHSLQLEILKRFKTEKEVAKFINKHLSDPKIREAEIETALQNNDLDRAEQLALDGIKGDKDQFMALVNNWRYYLLIVAQRREDNVKIIEYARYLFLESAYEHVDYFKILKEHVEAKKWPEFLEKLIREINKKYTWDAYEMIRTIYIKEKDWDNLFLLLKENLSLHQVSENEKYLKSDYKEELLEFYTDSILEFVEHNVGRNHYKTACRYLRKMNKLGGSTQVNQIKEQLKKQYPKRRALQEELEKV